MKASEIVTKIKDVLLSTNSEEEVTTPEVELKEDAPKAKKTKGETKEVAPKADIKEVSYSAEEPTDELQEDVYEDEIVEEAPAVEYATKDEVSEIKAMVEKLRGMIEAKEEAQEEVPQELSADEPAEAISHSPENQVSDKIGAGFAPNANKNTTYNRVLNAISNN
jgi:hypothetical protein